MDNFVRFNVISYGLIELLYNLHSLYIPQLQFLCLNMNVLVFIFCSMIVVINVNRCIGSSGNLETKLFRKVTVRYTDAYCLCIRYLPETKICDSSSDPWDNLPKLPSSGPTVSGMVQCGLHCHTDSQCSAFAFLQDDKTCQMKKMVGNYNCKKFNRILFLLHRLEAVFLGI